MKESPLFWPAVLKGNALYVLDETLLPKRLHYIKVKSVKEAIRVIRQMKTRAFGQFLVVLNTFLLVLEKHKFVGANHSPRLKSSAKPGDLPLQRELQKTAKLLNKSRPTFPFSEVTGIVLGWAKKAKDEKIPLKPFLTKNILGFLAGIRAKRLERVRQIAAMIKNGDRVLTHCNVSGELAMAASICKEQKKKVRFFATETRPYFQGAKLTCWELKRLGADVTLIADNAVGSLMSRNGVDKVIVGSDRSCANGDIANKIGTYQMAVLAKEFGVPFYALTQPSAKIKKGDDIPIEIRDPNEILTFEGKKIAPKGVGGFYPAFDIIPHELIERSLAIDVR